VIQSGFQPTSIDEFLTILAASEAKLELIDGEVLAFAGGTTAHGILCTRIVNLLSAAADSGCQVFTSDMALQRADAPTHVFPDATYTCEDLDPDSEMIFAPLLVVEVISRGSETRDRVKKLDAYQRIPSVREYLMIDSRFAWGCLFRRGDKVWTQTTYGIGDTIELSSPEVRMPMRELYAGTGRIDDP
jgi:Uma2 family endonuclease